MRLRGFSAASHVASHPASHGLSQWHLGAPRSGIEKDAIIDLKALASLPMSNPFEGIKDEAPLDGPGVRAQLLRDAKRGYAPLRKVFVQREFTGDRNVSRGSVLAALVTGRQERALDAFLLLHALEPVLDDKDPLPLSVWAKMLDSQRNPCTTQTAGRAFETLDNKYNLVIRESRGRYIHVRPRLEDGSAGVWTRPGTDPATIGKGYLTIPHDYWTSGLAAQLSMPGKAMFLIMLNETTQKPSFEMAVERAQLWYGISERTAERGYKELKEQTVDDGPLLLEHRQWVAEPRSPIQRRLVVHRALAAPYSEAARAELRKSASKAVRKADTKAAESAAPSARKRKKTTGKKAGKRAEPTSA
jgi:hypothetical protein